MVKKYSKNGTQLLILRTIRSCVLKAISQILSVLYYTVISLSRLLRLILAAQTSRMKQLYEINLPWPPSNNHYKKMIVNTNPRAKAKVTFFLSRQAQVFLREVAILFKIKGQPSLEKTKLRIEMDVHPPLGERGYDLDNVPKVVLDALQKAGAFKNDYWIWSLALEKKPNVVGGMVLVRVAAFEG